MPHVKRPATTALAAILTTAVVALAATAAHAANPTGRYRDARMSVTLRLNPFGSQRVALRDGTVKVNRRYVNTTFIDTANDRHMKLRMRLADRVLDVNDQIVVVATGEVFVKDLSSGAVIASGGEFVRGRFRIRRRNNPDRTWLIKHDQQLKVRRMSGILTGLSRGTLRAER